MNNIDQNEDADENSGIESNEDNDDLSKPKITLDVDRIASSQKKCCVCGRKREKSDKIQWSISNEAIIDVYLLKDIIIPFGSRACIKHFDISGLLNQEAIDLLNKYNESTQLKDKDYSDLLQLMRQKVLKSSLYDQFENVNGVSNQLCEQTTGK